MDSSSKPERAEDKERKVPLVVIVVALYQLAKVAFFAYVFAQCWEAQGTGIPPFGEVEVHNPMFEAPLFFLFGALAVWHLSLAVGLSFLGNWARACSSLLLLSTIPYWFLEHVFGYQSLLLPVETSKMLTAFCLEALAIAILYVTPQAREAFAPYEPSDGRAGTRQ